MPRTSSSSVKIFYPPHSRDEVVALLRRRMKPLREKLPVQRAVLFGSYAQRRYTIASDIDVLIVYAGRHRPDAYAVVKRTLDLPRLEPHVYTEEEYEQVKATVDRMAEGGVTLLDETSPGQGGSPH